MKVVVFKDLKIAKGIPFTRAHIYALEKTGDFPKRIKIGHQRVAWIEEEIDNWLKNKQEKANEN